ncbi:MAG: glycosyltransferase [Gammaproteobacteria bacterium]|jgi:N-acetylglucosaminyl-diphospho-decaprenol L-rhamnosyltransferase|nr:glycosyltransferase [Gammaproteobacteria bacterium]
MKKRFTIAIIHRNGFDRLKAMLDSAVDASNELDEIIIVDNASTDSSLSSISKIYKNIAIIRNNCNKGYGYAANQAIYKGSGEYFLICNNDITIPKDSLSQFENIFVRDSEIGMISGQQTNLNGDNVRTSSKAPSLFSEFDGIGRIDHSKDPKETTEVGILRGACLAVRKATIDKVGAYDDDFFFYFEDTEWCIRIARENWKVVIAPHIKIPHIGGSSSSEFYSQSRIEFYRSRIFFWKKIYPKYIVILLYSWNIPKLILDGVFYSLATALTFGLSKRLKNKLLDRVFVLTWLLAGQPKKWGLPGKC